MCRMLAGVAVDKGVETLSKLVLLLPEAAASDPYLAAITGGEDRHCHGYGYFAALKKAGSWLLVYERFDAADAGITEEEACQANLEALGVAAERLSRLVEASEEALVLFHARRAGRGEPRGSMNAHPFHEVVETPSRRIEVYLVHNGGLYKEKLVEEVGVVASAYTDSHVFTILLARYLGMGLGVEDAIEKAKPFVKSALDLGIAVLEPGREPVLYLYGYLSPGIGKDRARQDYYEPVLAKAPGLEAYISSTIRDLAREKIGPLEASRIQRLIRVSPSNIYSEALRA